MLNFILHLQSKSVKNDMVSIKVITSKKTWDFKETAFVICFNPSLKSHHYCCKLIHLAHKP